MPVRLHRRSDTLVEGEGLVVSRTTFISVLGPFLKSRQCKANKHSADCYCDRKLLSRQLLRAKLLEMGIPTRTPEPNWHPQPENSLLWHLCLIIADRGLYNFFFSRIHLAPVAGTSTFHMWLNGKQDISSCCCGLSQHRGSSQTLKFETHI